MKHIIMIKDMNCEHCVARISKALEEVNVEHEISLENKSVSVEKNGDIVAKAKRAITEAGYTIL
ncbi:MAG: copper chaperone [Erysipelotrichia bacterium]|nr:copper chaperone [Erysipelotrichia bacterium]NCC55112.1 copper chaperone [Erysipelotrichia bacterium]